MINKVKMFFVIKILLVASMFNHGYQDVGDSGSIIAKGSQDSFLRISSLPFGCSTIYKSNFPSEMKPPKVSITDSGKEYTSKKLYKSLSYFQNYCQIKAKKIPKRIEDIEYFLFNATHGISKSANRSKPKPQLNTINDSLLKLIDSIQFRLPNIGIHEVYFSTGCHLFSKVQNWRKRYGGESNPNFTLKSNNSGNLIIYNPTNQNAKVINLYRDMSGGYVLNKYRLFYINSYENIHFRNFTITETEVIPGERKTISLRYSKSDSTVDVITQ